ncbi:hypothetical protein HJG60_008815 [Phyllostomus discolor]|uniref:Uncharacterized protein n=1 Tax=Phyllostomus discolor TaxID=89673 RepID=A0A833YM88_9CHIR|nr:hypothetical protein HJG60_008815 [Phyllostomus discolor]
MPETHTHGSGGPPGPPTARCLAARPPGWPSSGKIALSPGCSVLCRTQGGPWGYRGFLSPGCGLRVGPGGADLRKHSTRGFPWPPARETRWRETRPRALPRSDAGSRGALNRHTLPSGCHGKPPSPRPHCDSINLVVPPCAPSLLPRVRAQCRVTVPLPAKDVLSPKGRWVDAAAPTAPRALVSR